MKVLILGGDGMLGHKAWQVLKSDLDVFLTTRSAFAEVEQFGIFDRNRAICQIDVLDFSVLEKTIKEISPEVILNCIGIVKQREEAKDPVKSIKINSLFPHKLSELCYNTNARLIHFSTDCVFSGKKGTYTEQDCPDPVDLYGRTKLLGEVVSGNALTLRTSIIGHELKTKHGLFEWFLSQEGGTVKGYTRAIFSGFPTVILCEILKDIIIKYKNLKGLYHIASNPIDKYSLLRLIKSIYNLDIRIEKYDEFVCDRSLNCSAFEDTTGFQPMKWDKMIEMMKQDSSAYTWGEKQNDDFK